MKVIITGATGMIGQGVLLECLDHPGISKVLTIGRNSTGTVHEKLTELVHKDFSDFSAVKGALKDYDACYYCMGVSAAGMNEADYSRLTYDYTMALARTLYKGNPEMTFIYVSGEGTDSSGKGRMMWARVKGRTENDLMQMGFRQVFAFRPGAILPLRGIKSKTRSYQFMYDYFTWLLKIIKAIFPNSIVNTTQIGLAMIHATLGGYDKAIIRPPDIIVLADKS